MTTLADALAQIDVLARNGSGKCTGTDCTGCNLGRAHAVALELLGRVTEAAESSVHGCDLIACKLGEYGWHDTQIGAALVTLKANQDVILAACRKEDTP